jgi:hypothetical protein
VQTMRGPQPGSPVGVPISLRCAQT